MQLRNTKLRYGAISQLLHWTIVVLIITQYVLASMAEDASLFRQVVLLARHKSFGILILGLVVLRLLWRLAGPVPAAPPAMSRWQQWVSQITHFALYALLLVQPAIGWLMSSARGFQVSFFNLFPLPDFIPADETRYEMLKEVHGALAAALFFIVLLHAAAALKHHFYDRDDVLRRMLPMKLRGTDRGPNAS